MQGFVLKNSQHALIDSNCGNNNNLWIHAGIPKDYLYTCSDCDDCKDQAELGDLPSGKVHFVSIEINKPNKNRDFKLNSQYEDYTAIYGFKCISERLTFNYKPNDFDGSEYNDGFRIKFNWQPYFSNQNPIQTLIFQSDFWIRKIEVPETRKNQYCNYIVTSSNYYNTVAIETLYSNWKFVLITNILDKLTQHLSNNFVQEFKLYQNPALSDQNSFAVNYSPNFDFDDNSIAVLTLEASNDDYEAVDYLILVTKYTETYCSDEVTADTDIYKRTFKFVKAEPRKWNIYLKAIVYKEELKFAIGSQTFAISATKDKSPATGIKLIKPESKIGHDPNLTFKAVYLDKEGLPTTHTQGSPEQDILPSYILKENKLGLNTEEAEETAEMLSKPHCYFIEFNFQSNAIYKLTLETSDLASASLIFLISLQTSECDRNYYSFGSSITCQDSCSSYAVDNLCFDECQDLCSFQEPNCSYTGSNNTCVDNNGVEAKLESGVNIHGGLEPNYIGINGSQIYSLFVVENNGSFDYVSECPSGKPYFEDDYMCLENCPSEKPYFDENYKCYSSCPPNRPLVLDEQCVYACPSTKPDINGNNGVNYCSLSCTGTNQYINGNECVASCTGTNQYINGNECVPSCTGTNQYINGNECVASCIGTNQYINGNECVASCIGFYIDPITKTCYTDCPNGMKANSTNSECYMDCASEYEENGQCVSTCSGNKFADERDKRCVSFCPFDMKTEYTERKCHTECPNFTSGSSCLDTCNSPNYIRVDGTVKYCEADCNQYTNTIGSEQYCVSTCPNSTDENTNSCINTCDNYTEVDGATIKCHSTCPSDLYQNDVDKTCKNSCTGYSYTIPRKYCISTCPSNMYHYETTNNTCVTMCMTQQFISIEEGDKYCRDECSSSKFIHTQMVNGQIEQHCRDECSSSKFIHTQMVNGQIEQHCRDECISPKFIHTQMVNGQIEQHCRDECISPKFIYTSGNTNFCRDECTELRFYKVGDSKYCDSSCPDTKPYFKGQECFSNCLASPYGIDLHVNSTKECKSDCTGYKKYEDVCYNSCSEIAVVPYDNNGDCVSACTVASYNNICYNDCADAPDNVEFVGLDKVCTASCEYGLFRGKLCVSSCTGNEVINQNECVSSCPAGMAVDANRHCSYNCSNYSKGEECLETCDGFVIPLPGFGQGKGECVSKCPPSLEYYHETDKVCLSHCALYQSGFKCLNECNQFIESSSNRLICKEECTDPKHLNSLKTRSICVTTDTTASETIKTDNTTYRVPLNCTRHLKSEDTLTDADCVAVCRDERAFALSIREHRCVTDCPQERPFFEGSTCVEQCSQLYTRHGECLEECDVNYPYTQELDGKLYCVNTCENDWLPGEYLNCYNPAKIECELPEVQFEDKCMSCPLGMLYEKGECVNKCSPCYTIHRLGDCQLCEGVIYDRKCRDSCPVGYTTNSNSLNCSRECVKCNEMEMFMDGDQCVKECPEDKFPRKNKCCSCEEVDSYETEEEKRICGSCENSFKNKDGSCTSNCYYFTFTKEKQQFCFNCGESFFYKDHCTDICPLNTVTYTHKKECLDLPPDCQKGALKCKRNSTCILSSSGPKCACRTGTLGLLCQAATTEFKEETDPQTVTSWSSIGQVNTITLENALKLQQTPISDQVLLESLQNLLDQACTTENSNFFILADFSLKDSTFESKTETLSRKQSIIGKILQKVAPTPLRRLSEATKYVHYEGENYSIFYSNDISSKVDLTECESKLRVYLNKPDAEFDFIYLQLNKTTVEAAPAASTTTLTLNSQPHVTVSIYYSNIAQDISTVCSLANVDVEYEVDADANSAEIEKLKDQGVNPFDAEDDFFTDVCSLSNSGSDLTLSKRKELFFVDPAKICNQQEGQICSIDQFSGEKVKCTCRGINNNPPSIGDSFASTFFESNFKVVNCYNRFFSRKMHLNPGFLLSFGVLLFFYVLQNVSLLYTFKRLKGKHFKDFLNNSLVVVNQVKLDLDKYFAKHSSPGIRIVSTNMQEITVNSAKKNVFDSSNNSANRLNQTADLSETEENLCKLKEIGPTRLDFDSLTVSQQIEYDKRSPCCIFAAQTLRNHTYLNVFYYDYLLIPLHIRQFLLMTITLVGMSLNAFFYTDTLINNRAKAKEAVFR